MAKEVKKSLVATANDDTAESTQQQRAYKGTQVVDHDLFKLEAAKMKKNVSYTEELMIELFDHCHMFHTVDSNGKKLDVSSPVGGHFHPIKVTRSESGVPEITVGPPHKFVMKKRNGRKVKVAVPVSFGSVDDEGSERVLDDHTHRATYLGSEKVSIRQPSVEFAKLDATLAMGRVSSVEGVTTR